MMFRKGVSFSEKMFFTKHLSVMLKSGVPISDVLETLIVQAKSSVFKKILQQVSEDVSKGQSLEKAFSKHPKIFDPFYLSLVRIGEKSGTLEGSLAYLTGQLEKANNLRKTVQSAMLYPSLVLAATGAIGFGLAFFVLPQIVDLFEDMAVDLPVTTQLLMFVARVIRDYTLLVISGLSIFLVAGVFALQSRLIKPYRDTLLLRLPVFGYFFRCVGVAALARNLGIMLRSGLPITEALATAAVTEGNTVFKRDLKEVAAEVQKGRTIGDALRDGGYPEFPPFVSRMIGVGEKSGNLEENLLYLGEYFEAEVDTITKSMTSILEPLLLLFIGAVVGFIVLSIVAPIYEITGSIS